VGDKYTGAVHQTPLGVSHCHDEPVGVIGIACPEENRLWVRLARGSRGRGGNSDRDPLGGASARRHRAVHLLDASDVPAGVINIVTGAKDRLRRCSPETTTWTRCGTAAVRRRGRGRAGVGGNMKRTWVEWHPRD